LLGNHGCLQHRRVLNKGGLHFEGANVQAKNLNSRVPVNTKTED
jgi:hypothetical protein